MARSSWVPDAVYAWLSRVPDAQGRRTSPVELVLVDVEELDGSPAVDARLAHTGRSTQYQQGTARNDLMLDAGHSGAARHEDRCKELVAVEGLECLRLASDLAGVPERAKAHHDGQRS